MQHVRRIGLHAKACRVIRIAQRSIEVDDGVELFAHPDPLVGGHAYPLTQFAVGTGAAKRQQRCAGDANAADVGVRNDLAIRGDDVVRCERLRGVLLAGA